MMTSAFYPSLRQLSKQWKLGALLYQLYYAPKGFITSLMREGVVNRAMMTIARNQMEQAAYQLEPFPASSPPAFDIHFLSGQKFWYQTCFCAYSMIAQSGVYLRPVIYDDGTLTQPFRDAIRRIFPNAQIIDTEMIEAQLDRVLPTQKFPTLRSRRLEYFNLRKLTDIHAGSDGWKLVLDSDMLFFHRPDFLLNWLKAPEMPCYMVDVDNAYGYSEELMTRLAGATIPERVNVGICGLNSHAIDWEELEHWCKTLIETEGTNYYQEQAMIAMLIARFPNAIAPENEYVLMPKRAEVKRPQAVMHHYVSTSKPWYFRDGWQHIVSASNAKLIVE